MNIIRLNQACISKINVLKKRELFSDEYIEKILLIIINEILSQWLEDSHSDYK